MRAVRSTGEDVAGRDVEVVDVALPDAGVVVTIRSASICGSDFGYIRGGSRFVLGHELAGTLDDGTAVAIEPTFGCGVCDQCLGGHPNRCRRSDFRVPGLTMDGGMSERYAVGEENLVPLPVGLDVADACLVEPAAVGWHGARVGGVGAGQRVAVVGGGSIGILAAAAARAQGADEVALEARHRHQREAGERLGASTVRGEYEVVIEAAGTEESLARAVDLAAPGGTVVVLGVYGERLPLPFIPAFMKEVRVVGSIAYCRLGERRDVDAAAAMLAASPEIAAALVTHRFPLEDAVHAFAVARSREAGARKVVVAP